MGSFPLPTEGEGEGGPPIVDTTLPAFPEPFTVPSTPNEYKRYQTGVHERELRPLAEPAIPVPDITNEDFLARYSGWQARTNGSIVEFIVWEYLVTVKEMQEGHDFVFQHPLLGGRTAFGGFVLDFFFPFSRMGWRVMGERFHLLQAQDRARDTIAEAILAERGISPIIDLWETDLLTRPRFVLELALDGQEVQRRTPR